MFVLPHVLACFSILLSVCLLILLETISEHQLSIIPNVMVETIFQLEESTLMWAHIEYEPRKR